MSQADLPPTVIRRIGRLFTAGDRGVIEDAAVLLDKGRIAWLGPDRELRAATREVEELDGSGSLVTPGLIDAHCHPLYGGNRFAEIAMRSKGASYAEIALSGGGIAATVRATRDTTRAELAEAVRGRFRAFAAGGTTTVEAKTGYDLSEAGELDGVEVLAEAGGGIVAVEVTFLAGHGVAPEWAGRPDDYIEAASSWCQAARSAGARHVDVFCDEGYFTVSQSRRLLEAGRRAGLIPRIHADELARTGGARLAAELGCASADHLLCITDDDARALAGSQVVATLAPITALAMGRRPPTDSLLAAGVQLALGSDHNPGTCGTTSMSLVVALAIAELGLSVEQALLAATSGGAASLRLDDRGRIDRGLRADLVMWDADHEGAFAWSYGLSPRAIWSAGLRR